MAEKVAGELPAQVWNDVKDDWINHKAELGERVGLAAVAGAATGLIFARSKMLASVSFGLIGLGQAGRLLGDSSDAFDRSWKASSEAERQFAAKDIAGNLGRSTTNFLETAPISAVTGAAGMYAARGFPVLSTALAPIHRATTPEALLYFGRGTSALTTESAGTADLLTLSDRLSGLSRTSGLEEARSFKLAGNEVKIGRPLYGDKDGVSTGRALDNVFHTHPDELLPSGQDYFAVRNVGIIDAQKQGLTVFFDGLADKLSLAKTAFREKQPLETIDATAYAQGRSPLQALVVDKQNQVAVAVERFTAPNKPPLTVRSLDYAQTIDRLRSWTGGRLNISDLPSANSNLTPDMLAVMGKITENRQ